MYMCIFLLINNYYESFSIFTTKHNGFSNNEHVMGNENELPAHKIYPIQYSLPSMLLFLKIGQNRKHGNVTYMPQMRCFFFSFSFSFCLFYQMNIKFNNNNVPVMYPFSISLFCCSCVFFSSLFRRSFASL